MFSDISQHWASQCIVALAKRGVIQGYPNGTFRPEATVSRAEFATLMQRVFESLPGKAIGEDLCRCAARVLGERGDRLDQRTWPV